MKKHIVYFLLIVSTYAVGQNNNGSRNVVFTVSYPIPIGDNFIANPEHEAFDSYGGIYALGLGYHFNLKGNFFLCFDFRYSHLYRQENSSLIMSEIQIIPSMNLEIWNPSIGVNYNVQWGDMAIIPQINLGYSLFRFYREDDGVSHSYYASNNAFTISTQMKLNYSFSEKISLAMFLAYDNSFLDKPQNSAETSFNKRNQWVQFLYPGLEFKIKI